MNSWTNIPHVTNHDEADITELEEFRTSLTDIYTGEKKKITPLAFIVKALTASLKNFPILIALSTILMVEKLSLIHI